MLSTIERVLLLKGVSLFSGIPDEALVDVACALEEMEVGAGERIIVKGDAGTSMYIVVDGRVRVHDGDHILNELGEGEFFGEMAVLDAAPRVASVTSISPTLLFRLHQDVLYELIQDQPDIGRGIIRVLSARIRDRIRDVTKLRGRAQELTSHEQVVTLVDRQVWPQ